MGCAPPPAGPGNPAGSDEAARQRLLDEIMAPCELGRVQPLVGRPLTDALRDEARRLTGLTVVRVRRPGQAYTQDFRSDRLNIDVDEAGRVIGLVCG